MTDRLPADRGIHEDAAAGDAGGRRFARGTGSGYTHTPFSIRRLTPYER